MTDANTQAIEDAISEPASVGIEGENITNRSAGDLLPLVKANRSDTLLANIAAGVCGPFVGVRIAPPGASGVGGGEC